MCESAWESISPFVMTLAHGGEDIYDGWIHRAQNAHKLIISIRPLETKEAVAIVSALAQKIKKVRSVGETVVFTRNTQKGRYCLHTAIRCQQWNYRLLFVEKIAFKIIA